ncbi:hypothetical protein [Paracoccus sp. IB05]|uniref:hypothetical protein n=1 Tax=Paracoccus sp. IB05 TaxID=2779367 RepID=UPI0018E7744F|nr:hypothetical protein [Paracoccus sp. IB05]MBJ2150601.1 hypothetical protein [Paracoccus sp. IB05]
MPVYTFPLTLAQFFDLLPIGSVRFEPTENLEISETTDGVLLVADIGVSLWQGTFILSDVMHEEALEISPLINLLRRAGASFLVTDPRRPWPRRDPGGALLSGYAPKLIGVAANRREINIRGLPPGYQLSRGDLVSFTYGAGPLRYGLHELMAPVAANSMGNTPLVEVSPPLRPGVLADADLTFVNPVCKAMLTPKTADLGASVETVTSEMSIRWMQTLG